MIRSQKQKTREAELHRVVCFIVNRFRPFTPVYSVEVAHAIGVGVSKARQLLHILEERKVLRSELQKVGKQGPGRRYYRPVLE